MRFFGRGQLAPFPPSSPVRSFLAAQQLACSVWSAGSLFCYVIKSKQQKFLNLAARGVVPTTLEYQNYMSRRKYQLQHGKLNPTTLPSTHTLVKTSS